MTKYKIISIISIISIMFIGCLLAGCDVQDGHQNEMKYSIWIETIYVDPDTGVNYVTSGRYGICPRYNADGTLYISDLSDN